ncbi:hypothetical protein T484DRAFT_1927975 [Baffinella frigidus]|nr:hypothetical protein T484DRAFT_1927975 [Cryptophyta sp. CCMP2293]
MCGFLPEEIVGKTLKVLQGPATDTAALWALGQGVSSGQVTTRINQPNPAILDFHHTKPSRALGQGVRAGQVKPRIPEYWILITRNLEC